ncbi:hypothetical protein MMC16_003541 [Acarospora aff. strigata]|nr:hypothetical protein [Acarospora aff. strigata]
MFPNNRYGGVHRYGGLADDLFTLNDLHHRSRGGGRRARSNPWRFDSDNSNGLHSDFEEDDLRNTTDASIGGHRRTRRARLDDLNTEGGYGLFNNGRIYSGHHRRSLLVRIPPRAPDPQISHDELLLFPQHILHLTMHVMRHSDQREVFRAAVPSSLTPDEILASVGLHSHSGYRVLFAWRNGLSMEEVPRDSRLASVIRRTGREPSSLYIERIRC